MSLPEPLSDETRNPGRDYWTCCACYDDLPFGFEGEVTCPSCGHELELVRETEIVLVARLTERA